MNDVEARNLAHTINSVRGWYAQSVPTNQLLQVGAPTVYRWRVKCCHITAPETPWLYLDTPAEWEAVRQVVEVGGHGRPPL